MLAVGGVRYFNVWLSLTPLILLAEAVRGSFKLLLVCGSIQTPLSQLVQQESEGECGLKLCAQVCLAEL